MHTTLPCLSTCLLLTHDVMRWIHLHEDIYKLQENNKEGAAFVSKGKNSMRYPWTKLYFSAQLHITAALVFDVKFHSSIDIESKIGGGPGPEYRTRHQAAGWTLRCPRVPLGCNLDNLTRCWLLEFYQSPQHETRAPASTRDLKWTNGDPFPLRYNV